MGPNIRPQPLSTHVLVAEGADTQAVLHEVQSALKGDFGVYFSTIQVENEICETESGAEDIDFVTPHGQH